MENGIRFGVAIGVFLLMLGLESMLPRRRLSLNRNQRWRVNLSLAALNMILTRLVISGLNYFAALSNCFADWGILPQLHLGNWQSILISLLVLDAAIYLQHRLSHHYPCLWRLHQIHHTDIELDLTSAVRFHPLEILVSLLYKMVWIKLIGAPPAAVLLFEILLNASATFNHSNFYLPLTLDKLLRKIIVTPDMHRIHHSTNALEMNRNYGFCLTLWDRLFGTYLENPQHTQLTMTCGLSTFQDPEKLTCEQLLSLPFQKKVA